MELLKNNPSDLNIEIKRFKSVCEQYQAFMSRHNRTVGSWNDKSIEALSLNGIDEIRSKANSLERQLSYYLSAETERITPHQESQILWRLLRSEKLKFAEDLFTKISDKDIIEIYTLDFKQFFANSTFMVNCSYDLSDLSAYPWPALFERPEEITRQIIEQTNAVIANPIKQTIEYNVEPHIGREVFSTEKQSLLIKMGVVSPLFDANDNLVGVVATLEPKPLGH